MNIEQAFLKTTGITVQDFISVAIEGRCRNMYQKTALPNKVIKPFSEILLNPLAWKAVAKAKGWCLHTGKSDCTCAGTDWSWKMHSFIQELIDSTMRKRQ